MLNSSRPFTPVAQCFLRLPRSESRRASIVSMQRRREYLAKSTKFRIRVADVEVLPLGDNAAVAFYTLQLHAQQIPIEGTVNQRWEEHLAGARVTHVFEREGNGELKIVHEHISMSHTWFRSLCVPRWRFHHPETKRGLVNFSSAAGCLQQVLPHSTKR
jgi:hypothetical protein